MSKVRDMRMWYILATAIVGLEDTVVTKALESANLDPNPRSTSFYCVIMGMSLTLLCLNFLICKMGS